MRYRYSEKIQQQQNNNDDDDDAAKTYQHLYKACNMDETKVTDPSVENHINVDSKTTTEEMTVGAVAVKPSNNDTPMVDAVVAVSTTTVPEEAPADTDDVKPTTTSHINEEDKEEEKPDAEMDTTNDDVKNEEDNHEGTGEAENATEGTETEETGKKKRKESGKNESTKAKATDTAATKRSSRERKSIETFNPDAYDKPESKGVVEIIEGRGTALKLLPAAVESIESASTDDITFAHKFLFVSRQKFPKKEMIQHLLNFSGYLPKKDSSMSTEEMEKVDDELEVRIDFAAFFVRRFLPSCLEENNAPTNISFTFIVTITCTRILIGASRTTTKHHSYQL
jgi:hypothetical protein